MLRKLLTVVTLAVLLSVTGGTVLSQDDEGGGGGGGEEDGGGNGGGGGEEPPPLVTPEPSTLVIWSVLAGTGAIAGLRRRRQIAGCPGKSHPSSDDAPLG